MNPDWTSLSFAAIGLLDNGQRVSNLVEIAVVPIDAGHIGESTTWLVRPCWPITADAERRHAISDAAVQDQPAIAEVAPAITEALSGRVVVAHQASRQVQQLRRELAARDPAAVIDTYELSRQLLAGAVASCNLAALAETLGLSRRLPPEAGRKRASYEALLCARLLSRLAEVRGGSAAIAKAAECRMDQAWL